jgi:hypothetical protein
VESITLVLLSMEKYHSVLLLYTRWLTSMIQPLWSLKSQHPPERCDHISWTFSRPIVKYPKSLYASVQSCWFSFVSVSIWNIRHSFHRRRAREGKKHFLGAKDTHSASIYELSHMSNVLMFLPWPGTKFVYST